MPKKAAVIALAAAVIAALLYGTYWWLAAASMRQGFDSWAAVRRAEGWIVGFGAVSVGGFPLRLALRIDAPSIGAPSAFGGWHWHGPLVIVAADPWDPERATWTAPGGHRLVPASGPPIQVRAGSASGVIERSAGDDRTTVTVNLGAVAVLSVVGQPRRTIERIDASIALPDRAGPTIDLRLTGLDLGETPVVGLASKIEEAAIAATLTGRIAPVARVRALELWRNGGGTLEIARIRLRWQRIEIDGEGTVALDGGLQPIAALSAVFGGYATVIDALAARGAIEPDGVPAIKFALGLLALASGNPRGRIRVPVTIQDRQLSLGPVPVMDLPLIVWK